MPSDFFAKLDKSVQIVYKIDKKCEKNHSMLNKTFINGMIEEMNKLYSTYLCKGGISKWKQC